MNAFKYHKISASKEKLSGGKSIEKQINVKMCSLKRSGLTCSEVNDKTCGIHIVALHILHEYFFFCEFFIFSMSNRMVSNSFATIIPLCSVRSIFAMHLVKDMLDFFPFKLWNN